MKPKVMVLQDVEVCKWRDYHLIEMSFEETTSFITELQHALFDHAQLSARTGFIFRIVVRCEEKVVKGGG